MNLLQHQSLYSFLSTGWQGDFAKTGVEKNILFHLDVCRMRFRLSPIFGKARNPPNRTRGSSKETRSAVDVLLFSRKECLEVADITTTVNSAMFGQ